MLEGMPALSLQPLHLTSVLGHKKFQAAPSLQLADSQSKVQLHALPDERLASAIENSCMQQQQHDGDQSAPSNPKELESQDVVHLCSDKGCHGTSYAREENVGCKCSRASFFWDNLCQQRHVIVFVYANAEQQPGSPVKQRLSSSDSWTLQLSAASTI